MANPEINARHTRRSRSYLEWSGWGILLSMFCLSACSPAAEKRRISQTTQTIQQIAVEVETLRTQTGHLPKDATELASLRGKPLQMSAWNRPIEYRLDKDDSKHFCITTLSPAPHGWVFCYDSKQPEAGVTVESF